VGGNELLYDELVQPGHRRAQSAAEIGRRVTMKMARSGGNAFFTNFNTYDAPFPSKVRLALANTWKKVRTRSSCCGNHGQPGC
jgi:hypothetical protein